MSRPDIGTAVRLMLFERVQEGHITGFADLYQDDDEAIRLPVALILDGWLRDLLSNRTLYGNGQAA